jgi:prepilin-type N-terminal cleavage/methylation domain-containing protein
VTTQTAILHRHPSAGRRGFTLIEVLVALMVATVVGSTAMLLLLASAREARRGVADAMVEQVAGNLQNEIVVRLRVMSASESVVFSGPATDSGGGIIGFRSIIIARGPASDYPREQITFDDHLGLVLYTSNRAQQGGEIVLGQNEPGVAIRQVCFSPSLKWDGTPDNALINVLIKLDDNNTSGRTASANPASICRTFSVRMRNN